MKKLSLALLAVCASVFAAEVDFNGGFEKCQVSKNGVPQPLGWNNNRAVSKKATARLTKEAGCVKSGTFALMIETEEGGNCFYRAIPTVPVKKGDSIEMEMFVKGSGKYSFQYIVYGADDPKHNAFLSTYGTGRPKDANEDNWQKHSVKVTFNPPAKAKGKFSKFAIIPVINVEADAEIYFDDFAMKVSTPEK